MTDRWQDDAMWNAGVRETAKKAASDALSAKVGDRFEVLITLEAMDRLIRENEIGTNSGMRHADTGEVRVFRKVSCRQEDDHAALLIERVPPCACCGKFHKRG